MHHALGQVDLDLRIEDVGFQPFRQLLKPWKLNNIENNFPDAEARKLTQRRKLNLAQLLHFSRDQALRRLRVGRKPTQLYAKRGLLQHCE